MKQLEIAYEFGDNGEIYLRVVKQTHIYDDFGIENQEFRASNGWYLASYSCPEFVKYPESVTGTLYVRGDAEDYDNDKILIPPECIFDINQAVDEYNRHFARETPSTFFSGSESVLDEPDRYFADARCALGGDVE